MPTHPPLVCLAVTSLALGRASPGHVLRSRMIVSQAPALPATPRWWVLVASRGRMTSHCGPAERAFRVAAPPLESGGCAPAPPQRGGAPTLVQRVPTRSPARTLAASCARRVHSGACEALLAACGVRCAAWSDQVRFLHAQLQAATWLHHAFYRMVTIAQRLDSVARRFYKPSGRHHSGETARRAGRCCAPLRGILWALRVLCAHAALHTCQCTWRIGRQEGCPTMLALSGEHQRETHVLHARSRADARGQSVVVRLNTPPPPLPPPCA